MYKILSFYEFDDISLNKVTKNKIKILDFSKNNQI